MDFIQFYQLKDDGLCERIIQFFEENSHLHLPGKSGDDEVKPDVKVSTDMEFTGPLTDEYSKQLNSFIEKYKATYVHCDEGLVLGPLHLLQVLGRLADQGVEEPEELVVRLLHDFPV